jgi:uncharacterized protein (UPF0332 family)
LNAVDLMAKAIRAASSARLLCDAGDYEGACDRAYYAMFNAARAALLASGANEQEAVAKTHGGLISAFSLQLVKTQKVPVEYGRLLNKVEELRLIADYKGDPIEQEKAEWAVESAHSFVETIGSTFKLNESAG